MADDAATHPMSGEVDEMHECFDHLVQQVRDGSLPNTVPELAAYLRSDESTAPARMVYFTDDIIEHARSDDAVGPSETAPT